MSGSTSIVTAENRALGGNNESQDSQQVLDLYQQIYGVGLVSVMCPALAHCNVPLWDCPDRWDGEAKALFPGRCR